MTALASDYARQGFVVARGLLPSSMAAAVRSDVHALVRLQLAATGGATGAGLEEDMVALVRADPQRYLAALRRGAKLLSLHRLLTDPAVTGVVEGLGPSLLTVCSEPVLHVAGDRVRVPGGYLGFAAHQDWPSIQGSLDCVVVWVALSPITLRTFPLQVVPGSHLRGHLPAEVTEHVARVPERLCPDASFVAVTAEPGDVVLMNSWTVHRTGVDGCTGLRLAASTRYDNAAEPSFVDRRYPCAYQRTVHRELFTPDFPSVAQIKSVLPD